MTVKKKVDKMLSHFVTPPFFVRLPKKLNIIRTNKKAAAAATAKKTIP